MKKIIALCLCICMALACLTSCNNNTQPKDTTTQKPIGKPEKTYTVDGNILVSCIGQADENGVFVIPDNITMIAESAFAGDSDLREVVIGADVKVIGSGAFQYCTSLETVTIGEGVETIGSHAFTNCSSLKNITLPSTVKVLNEYAFYACESLESISLDHIRQIKESAFYGCTSLESVAFSSELEELGSWAFSQCGALESVSFDGVTKLEELSDYLFTGCAMLRSMEIPQGVRRIGVFTFYDCSRLSSVTIPDSVESIDFGALTYTRWYQDNSDDYLIVGDGVLIKCTAHPSVLDLSGKGIKMIGGSAFYNAVAHDEASVYGYKYADILDRIVIPDTVREIGKSAFAGCIALKNITLSKELRRIDNGAFNLLVSSTMASAKVNLEDCTKLEYIGAYAFQGCNGIENLVLPASVKHVGEYAFDATKAQTNFIDTASKATEEKDRYWIVGDILLSAYVADGQTAVHIPEGVKIIAGSALCGWDSAYAPEDSKGLSASGVSKFNITNKVTELYLPEGVESIGNMAFFRMACVETIGLPSTLKTIGTNAFCFCTKLSEVTGGEGLQEISDYAFSYCASITNFQIPENVSAIGANVFAGCSSLKTVHLPQSFDTPSASLFDESCTSLTQIFVNASVRPRIYFLIGPIQQAINVDYYK
ncbi:MAG: leucine-rich repeat domain-containing protein [Clostridia bacterium]|nr:leucine-rich repeat domain-containing protein [Clostridia bacterium]